jgi:formate dehydrogenase major subunit
MPYHFREAPCNRLTNCAQDPISHMPELKACAVALTPLAPGQAPHIELERPQEVDYAGL